MLICGLCVTAALADVSATRVAESAFLVQGDQPATHLSLSYGRSASLYSMASVGSLDITVEVPDLDVEALDLHAEVSMTGKLLNYPNPVSLSREHTTVAYTLTKAETVRLELYSLSGFSLYSQVFPAESTGGSSGYNRVQLDSSMLGSAQLSPGVYILMLRTDDRVLGKNKMVVVP